jgi:hypothetical protein
VLVGELALAVAGRDGAELLEPEEALHGVALLAASGVEDGRAAPAGAAVLLRVFTSPG